jgi:hypothetical protein
MWPKRFRFVLWNADSGQGTAPDQGTALDPNSTGSQEAQAEKPDTVLASTALTGEEASPATAKDQGAGTSPDDKGVQGSTTPGDTVPGYDLAFEEGVQVDTDLLGQFQKTAHELGLTKSQAQKVADLYAGHVATLGQKQQEAHLKALNDYINTQNAELSKRPGFEADCALAKKTLKEFGSQDLIDVLRETAMGSHPALFDFMVKVGQALGEPGFRGGGGQSAEPPLHERVWGKDGLGPGA